MMHGQRARFELARSRFEMRSDSSMPQYVKRASRISPRERAIEHSA
jgi:hypothetical protein